jgi:hypothetical protein
MILHNAQTQERKKQNEKAKTENTKANTEEIINNAMGRAL